MGPERFQTQRIAQHEDAGQGHCTRRENGRQRQAKRRVQGASRQRYQRGVVGKRPEQVLADVCQCCAAERDGVGHAVQVVSHQHH
ncbi:hypothetical protein D3C86_1054090 [compost metagenome]